ncbi:MAG: DUF3137 domain-containing protein [Thermoflexibacter sp.]|jgi:hypothetical protein|nr:DUF3137 domain-containing protein [Thermoflexibacter sp.]
MKSSKEYSEFCEKTLFPQLEEFEQRRKAIGNKRITFLLIVLIIIVLHAIAILLEQLPIWSILISMLVVPFIFSFLYKQFGIDNSIAKDAQHEVIKASIPFLMGGALYDEKQGVPYELFARSRLFLQLPEHYEGKHLTKGRLDGSLVLFSEVHCGYFKTGEKKPEWNSIFDGLLVINAFERSLGINAVIIPSDLEKNLYLIGKTLQKHNFQRDSKVPFDSDKDFSNEFVVYADKPLEASSLISSNLREAILAFKNMSGIDVYISFIEVKVESKLEPNKTECKIYFAFATESLVDVEVSKTLIDVERVNKFFLCLNFVNEITNSLRMRFIRKPGVDWTI